MRMLLTDRTRELCRFKGHELRIRRDGCFFDSVSGQRSYIGHARSNLDAFNRWKNYLMSRGIEPSGARWRL